MRLVRQSGDAALGHAGHVEVVGRPGQLDAGGDADRGELVHLVAAQAYGAGPIMVVEPDETRRAVALELGADAAVAPGEAVARGRDLTGGEGFPSVAMAVGLAEALALALDLARRLGRINLFAGFPPGSTHTLDLNRVHYDEVRILGTQNAPFHLYGRAASPAEARPDHHEPLRAGKRRRSLHGTARPRGPEERGGGPVAGSR
jgi:hypothetical protein